MIVSDLSPTEYNSYTSYYINKVANHPFHEEIEKSKKEVISFFRSIPQEKLEFRYAEGKWTVKEILQHMIDVDRIFSYRVLRFGRGDLTLLPGFEVDDYVGPSKANQRTIEELITEFNVVREGTQLLFKSLPAESLKTIGIASGHEISVRAAGFKLIGHDMHHCEIIKERYL